MMPKQKIALISVMLFTVAPTHAADPRNGQALHDKHCVGCHVQQFGGDGSRVYTRENRRIKDYRALVQRVAACNGQTGAKWFPDEEADVAAYLNQRFYKFKP